MQQKLKIAALLLLAFFVNATAALGQIRFNKPAGLPFSYNGSEDVFPTDSGYVCFGINFQGFGQGYTQKQKVCSFYDFNGNLQSFHLTYLDSTQFHGCAYGQMDQMEGGGYIYGGGWSDRGNNDTINAADFMAIYFKPNGDTVWTKRISYPYYSTAYGTHSLPSKKSLVVGTKVTLINGSNWQYPSKAKSVVVKLDSLGNIIWEKEYHEGFDSFFHSVTVLSNGDYVFSGKYLLKNDINTYHNMHIICTDSMGNQKWIKELGGPYSEFFASVSSTDDGDVIVAGSYCLDQAFPQSDCAESVYYLTRLAGDSGNVVWEKQIDKSNSQWPKSQFYFVRKTNDGNFIAGGDTYYFPDTANYLSYIPVGGLMKFDSQGNEIWYREYKNNADSVNIHEFASARPALDGGYICTGRLVGFNFNETWILKTDANGCIDAGCINGIEELDDHDFRLSIYPNPAEEYVSIDLPILYNTGTLQAYTMQGQLVKTAAITTGGTQTFSIADLPNGIYQLVVYSSTNKLLGREKLVVAR